MGNAIFLFQLRCGNFEVALEFEFAVNDVVDGIGSPIQWVKGATSRPCTPAPFVSKEHLGAVIVECGGMPIGETWIDHDVDTRGFQGVSDIEQDAVARACSGCNIQ